MSKSNKESNSEEQTSTENFRWIMYHLTALDYGRDKLNARIAEITEQKKLREANITELRKIVRDIKKSTKDYQNFITYHQRAAIDRIPEHQRKKWEEEFRNMENQSYFNTFVGTPKKEFDASKNAFRTARDLTEHTNEE